MKTRDQYSQPLWINRPWITLAAPLLLIASQASHSAPGILSDVPLFTTSGAEPNIFFMLDDSNSMNTELMTSEDVNSWGGVMKICTVSGDCPDTGNTYQTTSSVYYKFVFGSGSSGSRVWGNIDDNVLVIPTQAALDTLVGAGTIDNTASVQGVWRARNHNYNKQYYNPKSTYTAWATYSEITDETSVPAEPGSSTTVNLTSNKTVTTRYRKSGSYSSLEMTYYPASYWVWVDSDNDGVVDETDTHTKIEIKAGTAVCANGTDATNAEQAAGAGCMLRSYSAEIDNFANWFAYHRRREFSAKYALSQVISPASGVRMGIATIHNDNTNEEKAMASMEASPTSTNKAALLTALFNMNTTSNTPLFDALEWAGNYFACSGSTNFGTDACAIETTAVDPATEAAGVCQQNFTLLVTDGDYTDSDSTPGNADSSGGEWTENGITYDFDGDPYADSNSNTLADMAMHFYERDLHPDLDNKVPTSCGVDENPGQHMVTYTVGFGVTGNISAFPNHPNLGYASECEATPAADRSKFYWNETIPDPDYPADPTKVLETAIDTFEEEIDDLAHAAFNGRGNYYSANDPDELIAALNNAITSISDRKGSAAAVSFNSSVLDNNSVLYMALFNSTKWRGQLLAFGLDGTNGDIDATATWDAATQLDINPEEAPPTRHILTHDGSNGVAFVWDNLTATQKADLKTGTDGTAGNNATGKARLAFLRGDRRCEYSAAGTCEYSDTDVGGDDSSFSSKIFRSRGSRLGDMVHSASIFVGAPGLRWPDAAPFPTADGSKYSDYKADATISNRTKMLYIGANDGMLHAFQASNGEEKLAYIPSNLFSSETTEGLHYLADPSYGHRYYVDLTPTISDIYIDIAGAGDEWATVLIGGERGGGKGLFALDITDPSQFNETNASSLVLWEFDSTDDADLGYTFAQPVIAMMNNGEWAVITGNGYNNTGSGRAKLFIIFIEGGIDGTWTAGTDYKVIDTGIGSISSSDCSNAISDCNGLSSTAAIDLDGNGTVDRVYAGDLKGNMWAFDLSSATIGEWEIAHEKTTGSAETRGKKPLFTAKDSSGNVQPITVQPQIVKNPDKPDDGNGTNVLVLFGTGQYMATGDKSTTGTQTFYGVWDNFEPDNSNGGQLLRGDLVEQTFLDGFPSDTRVSTDNSVNYTNKSGWYIDLPDSGERVIANALVRGELIYFNTLTPSVEPCTYGGSSWFMTLKYANGGRSTTAILDTTGNGIIDADDLLDQDPSAGTIEDAAPTGQKNDATFGGPTTLSQYRYDTYLNSDNPEKGIVEILNSPNTGRLSWEELR